MSSQDLSVKPERQGWASLLDLTPYHWFVFSMASLAWLFDCLDQQLFLIARNSSMKALLPEGYDLKLYGGYATSIFVAGRATGGLIFGSVGDRIGRAKTLTMTVLLYSIRSEEHTSELRSH